MGKGCWKVKLKEHLRISGRAVRHCFGLSKRYTVCLALDAVLSAAAGYIPIYFSAKVIDALCQRLPLGVIVEYVILTVGVVFLVKLVQAYISSVKDVAVEEVYRNVDWMYSEKAMQMAYESMEDPEVTRLRYRIWKESQTGYNLYSLHRTMEGFCSNIAKIIASLAMSASFFLLPAVPLGQKLAMAAGLLLAVSVSGLSTAKSNQLDNKLWAEATDMNVMAEQFQDYIDDYGAGKDIRLYDMGDYLASGYLRRNADYYNMYVANTYRQALWALPAAALENLFKFGVYAVLIGAAIRGGVTVGSIAKYVACMMLLAEAVADMAKTVLSAMDNNKYLKRYFSYFDIPNKMYQGSLTVEKRDDSEYDVEFRNVSFRYPNTETYALRNINLKFKIGEKLAIVGSNGSGKTTFIKLLCRLYDPCEGEILLNGVNIQKYDYDEYMFIFAVVFQDFRLFSFPLGEVVASGKDYDGDKVRDCLAKAGFGGRYGELPKGGGTCLYKDYDESGIEISGGEAQKIALARALYKDAPFILLDEPTAALDPVSEYEVYSSFNAIVGGKTAVYISHRLASCRFCDKIAVFDGGEIVQVGTHGELLGDENGEYYKLWEAQAQYYR